MPREGGASSTPRLLESKHRRLWNTCMGRGQDYSLSVIAYHLLVRRRPTSPRPELKTAGRLAERPSRVAAGHREAPQPLTVARPAAGLRSGRGDVGGGVRTTSEASPPWTRYRVADLYSVDPSGPEP